MKKSSGTKRHLANRMGEARKQADAPETKWTEAKNARRCELIDKKIHGTLQEGEADELALSQDALSIYVNRVAPLPIEAAQRLHDELLKRKKGKQ